MLRSRSVRSFLRHFVEMVLAMVLGMVVLDGLLRGALAAAGTDFSEARDQAPALLALAMLAGMSLPMAAWMRHRRHSWPRVAEMSGAMFLPVLVLMALHRGGAIDARALLDAQHGAMVACMLAVMLLRRGEYARPPAGPRAGGALRSSRAPS